MDDLGELVLGDAELFRRLDRITDQQEFSLALEAVARQHGLSLVVADIRRSLVAAHREWLERWV